MKLHSIILRILIAMGVIAFIVARWAEAGAFSPTDWGFWAVDVICIFLLFLPFPSARLLGAGGLFCEMLGWSLTFLHGMTNYYPSTVPSGESLKALVLFAFLGLLVTTACVAVVIWEVHLLKKPPAPVDAEEPEFTRPGAWDEGREQEPKI